MAEHLPRLKTIAHGLDAILPAQYSIRRLDARMHYLATAMRLLNMSLAGSHQTSLLENDPSIDETEMHTKLK